jgi:hypothetical protein
MWLINCAFVGQKNFEKMGSCLFCGYCAAATVASHLVIMRKEKEVRWLFLVVERHNATSTSTGKALSQSCVASSTYHPTQHFGEWLRKTTEALIQLASPRSFSAVRDSRTVMAICVCVFVCVCVCVHARACTDALKTKAVLYYRFVWYQPIFMLDFRLSQPCWSSQFL